MIADSDPPAFLPGVNVGRPLEVARQELLITFHMFVCARPGRPVAGVPFLEEENRYAT